jgi:hypothetical protein
VRCCPVSLYFWQALIPPLREVADEEEAAVALTSIERAVWVEADAVVAA